MLEKSMIELHERQSFRRDFTVLLLVPSRAVNEQSPEETKPRCLEQEWLLSWWTTNLDSNQSRQSLVAARGRRDEFLARVTVRPLYLMTVLTGVKQTRQRKAHKNESA